MPARSRETLSVRSCTNADLRMADADDLAGLKHVIAANHLGANDGVVAAFQIAKHPMALGVKHLGVSPAASLVFDDDLASRRPADGDGLSGREAEHVRPLRAFTNYEIGQHPRFICGSTRPVAWDGRAPGRDCAEKTENQRLVVGAAKLPPAAKNGGLSHIPP